MVLRDIVNVINKYFFKFGNQMLRIIIVILLFSMQLFAGYSNLGTRLYIETKLGYKLEKLVFGINENASIYLDKSLGESELPPFPPPQGIHAGFMFMDTSQKEMIMSYKDYKPFPLKKYDTVKYVLRVMKGAGDIITFKWNPLGNNIFSAVIVDKLTGGKIININMKDSSKAKITNEFVEKFELYVLYEPITDVVESNDVKILNVFPTECTDKITINGSEKFVYYRIYDVLGSMVNCGELVAGFSVVDVSGLASGVYIIAVLDGEGNRVLRKVVKS